MDELLHHLANDEVISLYPKYTHTTAEVYNVLYFAVRDHADELHLTHSNFTWLNRGKLIKSSKISGKATKYRNELERVRALDPIIQRFTQVIQSDPDEFVIAFISV